MQNNARLGITLIIVTTVVFAAQDGISRHLGSTYNVQMIVMLRYWFFALFVLSAARRSSGGILQVAKTAHLGLQILRGIILAVEIWIAVLAFTLLGLIESHAIFACYPLLIAALSGPILGEKVGWRRWSAIVVGFTGLLIILRPGVGVFSTLALLPLLSAILFAIYGILNRYVARNDRAGTSFFWTGVVGAIVSTGMGIWYWEPMTGPDWIWMGVLCVSGALGHWLLIKSYEVAEASVLQPFAYLQLVFVAFIGLTVFGEELKLNVALGTMVVIAAGLFTLWRERLKARTL
jgi:drug/metabolite transporter (DMT)-like permease